MKALGHIIRVEIEPSEEGSGRYGVCIEAREHDAPIGFGYPHGKRMWFAFDDPRLPVMFGAIKQPVFTAHADLIGVEVEMTTEPGHNGYRALDVLTDLTVTGGKRRYLESDIDRSHRERREAIEKKGEDGLRSRRFYGCRAAENMRLVIENLEVGDLEKNELVNLTNCLLRMVLIQNDGQISTQKLQAF